MLSLSPASSSTRRISRSSVTRPAWRVWMLDPTSIMLSVISGLMSAGCFIRAICASRSDAACVRSQSRVLTSCSSSSTPSVRGADLLNTRPAAGAAGAATAMSFAPIGLS